MSEADLVRRIEALEEARPGGCAMAFSVLLWSLVLLTSLLVLVTFGSTNSLHKKCRAAGGEGFWGWKEVCIRRSAVISIDSLSPAPPTEDQ